uniref:Activating signal cointegrator 1 complex subunit 3 n=1 Tax=Phallusia mammillata TaxID=59560 RepID=A0A6F9DBI7_9ASCI|nr:probable ATP-dependent RNA helicase DHX37 [Phallusia mammillata]
MGRSRRKYGQDFTQQDSSLGDTNQLIIPLKSTKSRKMTNTGPLPKKLSKKQRKKLEKVLESKKKKEKRSDLLVSLSQVQVETSELAMLDSVAHMGTKNAKLSVLSKRPLPADLRNAIQSQSNNPNIASGIKGWSGRRKRRKKEKKSGPKKEKEVMETSDSEQSEVSNENDVSEVSDIESESDIVSENEQHLDQNDNKVVEEKSTIADSSVIQEKVILNQNAENPKDIKPPKSEPVTYIQLDRTQEIQESRLELPILAEEQAIMEAIKENNTVIICGETGSGKTTQVPQFLYEAGYCNGGMIGITEPRRVAAVSMSKRVATEMNLPSSKVSYHIRYDNNVTKDTRIKFMTEGILTREMKADFLLSKYSVIILDEAHERTANTDVLIGLLSRIVPLRKKKDNPLKLIIMSATLRIEDFTENRNLFKISPPLLKIDVRQFPVTVHFNKKTPFSEDKNQCPYLNEAYKKICKIHRTLPSGGLLVFVTGKQEVHALMRKLNNTFPTKQVLKSQDKVAGESGNKMPEINLDDYKTETLDTSIDDDFDVEDIPGGKHLISDDEDNSDSEIHLDDSAYTSECDSTLPLHVLPLYSLLTPARQKLVFEPPPEGCRLCVIATNVAETSLTIPGVKYVVDTGKVKKKMYDKTTGISSFQVTWVSKASANQRAGRAGRTEPGHAYRLYSSAVFQDFDDFDLPEISTKPVAGLVLQMKSMHIDRVVNFPFPTPPPLVALESAEKLLIALGAVNQPPPAPTLRATNKSRNSGKITELGKLMSSFPVHPRFAKMIAMAIERRSKSNVIAYVITIVASLTVRELFFAPLASECEASDKDKVRQIRARLQHLKALWSSVGGGAERKALGDLMVLLGAVGAAEYSGASPSYCASHCIRPKALLEIRKLRAQLTNTINYVITDCDVCIDPKMQPPTDDQVRLLRQITVAAFGDHVARLIPKNPDVPASEAKKMRGAYQCLLMDEPVFIHPESVLSRDPLPAYVTFQEIVEMDGGKHPYMRDIVAVEPEWLASFCPNYCTFSKPLSSMEPTFERVTGDVRCHVTATYGRLAWQLGEVEISFPPGLERYRWFARFLLEGQIVTSLKRFVTSLLSRPATMVKTWANLQPRTETMLGALSSRGVDSKLKLLEAWKQDQTFLRKAYLEWLPQSLHQQVMASWPPING